MKKNTKKKTKQSQVDELATIMSHTTKTVTVEKRVEEVSASFDLELVRLYLHQKFPDVIPKNAKIEAVQSDQDPEEMTGVRVWWHEEKEEK